MSNDHEITIERLIPKGKNNHHYVAICSCKRWRSDPYRERENAVNKGEAHVIRGDNHNRAMAALARRNPQIKTELQWYQEQALDPLNSEADREVWQQLADELADRLKGDGSVQSELPFE